MMVVVCVAMMCLMVFGGMHHGMRRGSPGADHSLSPTNEVRGAEPHPEDAAPPR